MIVKVWCITNLEDARLCVAWGANALGFNFYVRSPRYIRPEKVARITEHLPSDILSVGILVRKSAQPDRDGCYFRVNEFLCWPRDRLPVQAVQLYGLNSESEIPSTDQRTLVATSFEKVNVFGHQEIVIDSSWGTGKQEDWEALRALQKPFILSGGLNPENVIQAIRLLRPAGVDVCSGVELTPGRKDPTLLETFLKAVRSATSDE